MLIKETINYSQTPCRLANIESLSQELADPLLPSSVEWFQQFEPCSLSANSVVYWVYSNQFQVLQCPVEWHCWRKEVYCAIFVAEFSRIIGRNRDGVSQSEQNGSSRKTQICAGRWCSNDIRNGIKLEAYVATVWQEFNVLNDVQAMANSDAACLHSDFNIVVSVVSSVTCVVHLLQVQIWIFLQNFICHSVVFVQRASFVLFLNEVDSYSFWPSQLAYSSQKLLVLFIWKFPQSEENKAYTEIGVIFCDSWKCLIKNTRIWRISMNLNHISLSIVFS